MAHLLRRYATTRILRRKTVKPTWRLGIDLGGTKIEAIVLDPQGEPCWQRRLATPRGNVSGIIEAIAALVEAAETELGQRCTVGVGTPGSISPRTGLLRGSNSTELNGTAFDRLLAERLGREVRIANDANCFALSEAVAGAGQGYRSVFGVILGTGVGGGLILDQRVHAGRHGIAAEWGHNPLPWMSAKEIQQASTCYCGKAGCIETWLSGPGIARHAGPAWAGASAADIATRAEAGDPAALAVIVQVADRLARALASLINVLDPDCIVLGGGVSNIRALYRLVPKRLPHYVFSDYCDTPVLPNRHGDASGVRGAAWLWPA